MEQSLDSAEEESSGTTAEAVQPRDPLPPSEGTDSTPPELENSAARQGDVESRDSADFDDDSGKPFGYDPGDPATDITPASRNVKIVPDLLAGLGDRLLRDNFLILECIESEVVLPFCTKQILQDSAFQKFRICTAQSKTLSLEELWNIRGPEEGGTALLLSGRSRILDELWTTDDSNRYETFLATLKSRRTVVLFTRSVDGTEPVVSRQNLDKHRVLLSDFEDWILPLISAYYEAGEARTFFGQFLKQHQQGRWPTNDRQLQQSLFPVISRFRLADELNAKESALPPVEPAANQTRIEGIQMVAHSKRLTMEKFLLYMGCWFDDFSNHAIYPIVEEFIRLKWISPDEPPWDDETIVDWVAAG